MPGRDAPVAARALSVRALQALLAVLLVLVGAVLVCEALGWPFLAGPLERQLSQRLERSVRFGAPDGERGFRLRLLGRVRLHAAELEIGAPSWSEAPHFLHAHGIRLALPYAGLWQASRGKQLIVSHLEADRLSLHAQRLADGRASWQFADPDTPQAAAEPLPRIDRLMLSGGEIHYSDSPSRIELVAQVSLSEGSAGPAPAASSVVAGNAAGNAGLRVDASGRFRGAAFKLRLDTAGVLPLIDDRPDAPAVPLRLQASAGGATLSFAGTVVDALALHGMTGRFELDGRSLGAAGAVFGLTLPRTGAFSTAGAVQKDASLWKVVFDRATIGSSDLRGAFTYDSSAAVPLLAGRLSGRRVLLADLAPAIGAPTKRGARPADEGGKLLPSREFDLPSLRAMNANLLLDIERLELGGAFEEPLQPLQAWLRLRSGVLAIGGIDARTARGRLSGELSLDGTGQAALWRADLRWSGIRLEQWLAQSRGPGEPPYIAGRLAGHAKLSGEGRSTAQILGTLKGGVQSALTDGSLSHLAVEAVGIDVAEALGVMIGDDESLPLRCAIADLKVDKGVMAPTAIVLDTRDSTLFVSGSVTLRNETIDLRVAVEPKDFSPLALRTPVLVRGTLSNPEVSLKAGPLAARVGAAALLAMINPLAALIPLFDPGGGSQDVGCQALLEQARTRKAGS